MKTSPLAADNPPSSRRIIALDILRGYFMIAIISIHLLYIPSLFNLFDGRGELWISEAEGFFLISGLLVGIIRHRDLARGGGMRLIASKLWKRGWTLYATGAILTMGYEILGRWASGAGWHGVKSGLDTNHSLWHVLMQTLTFQYSYGWTDFLIYYAAFMLVAPAVIWLLRRRLWWAVLILSYLALVWRTTSLGGALAGFLQWQTPFFFGCVIGFHWDNILGFYHNRGAMLRRVLAWGAVAMTAIIYILGSAAVLLPSHYQHRATPSGWVGAVITSLINLSHNNLYNKLLLDGRAGLLRPVLLVIAMAGGFVVVRRYERTIIRWAGKLLVPFGQNSLYVYVLESALLFTIPLFVGRGSFWLNSSLELGMIGLIWLALRRKFLFSIIPR